MKLFFMPIFFFFSLLSLLISPSLSATILVDGVSPWNNPTVHIGDSIIFEHKDHYKLYIFRTKNGFNLCNLTQATILTKSNLTSYMWHPSRPGFFYFSINNGSLNSCQQSQKLSIQVLKTPPPTPSSPPLHSETTSPEVSPAPTSGGGAVSSSPVYPWPFHPNQGAFAPVPMIEPSLVPEKGGAIPFINSNPAVPLPTGEVDSATIRPLSTSSGYREQVMVGLVAVEMALFSLVLSFVM